MVKVLIYLILSLFLSLTICGCETPKEPDTIPPNVIITFPLDNSSVNEIVSITCMATDNEGIQYVELWVDGLPTDEKDYSEPYSLKWNTTSYLDNTRHTIVIRAFDNNKNKADSDPIYLIVDNSKSYPDPISITKIISQEDDLIINWEKSKNIDFKFYDLEKSNNQDMTNSSIIYTSFEISDTSYTDHNISPLTFLYYRVIVSDTLNYKTVGEIYKTYLDTVFPFPDSNLTYIDHIQPLFTARCTSRNGCHSTVDQAGGLDLTDYQDIRQHMVNGSIPLVFSGDGENSILYQILLTSFLDRQRMPIDGPYLNTNNSTGVKTWIDEGLKYSTN